MPTLVLLRHGESEWNSKNRFTGWVDVDLTTLGEQQAVAAGRLLTADERRARGTARLAARFAAKEAVAKALGAPGGLRWHDAEVVTEPDGRPRLTVRGTVAAAAASRGVRTWHLSLSHDGGTAVAMVVAES